MRLKRYRVVLLHIIAQRPILYTMTRNLRAALAPAAVAVVFLVVVFVVASRFPRVTDLVRSRPVTVDVVVIGRSLAQVQVAVEASRYRSRMAGGAGGISFGCFSVVAVSGIGGVASLPQGCMSHVTV